MTREEKFAKVLEKLLSDLDDENDILENRVDEASTHIMYIAFNEMVRQGISFDEALKQSKRGK